MKQLKFGFYFTFLFLLSACSNDFKSESTSLNKENSTSISSDPSIDIQVDEPRSFTFEPIKSDKPIVASIAPWIDLQTELNTYLPRVQELRFNASSDTVIKGAAGSVIAIASNSLEFENGIEAGGLINLQLTEYTKPSQFAAKNLITRTVNGELLETVGMLDIVATQDGKKLKLKAGEEVSIAFPLRSKKGNFQVWDAKTNTDGLVEWRAQTPVEKVNLIKQKSNIPVHMHPLVSDQKNQFVMLQTCNGNGWQTYFNNRFAFPDGEGTELLDEKNFLAYAFKVNKSGKVIDLFVDEKGLPEHVIKLSEKYEWLIQSYFSDYPKLNLCRLPDFKKQVFRFIVKPGSTSNHKDLIALNELEGGYTTLELSELYESTGEDVYLEAYLQKVGTVNRAKIPQTKAKRSSKIMKAFLTATGTIGATVLSVASLGLINGDCMASMGANVKYKKGIAMRAMVTGTGAALYMVFKNMGSFIKANLTRDGDFTFGDRIPKGEEVTLIAVSERGGQRFMDRIDHETSNENIAIIPTAPFDLGQFQNWLDNPKKK